MLGIKKGSTGAEAMRAQVLVFVCVQALRQGISCVCVCARARAPFDRTIFGTKTKMQNVIWALAAAAVVVVATGNMCD